jgi:hypothetical protein
MNNAKLKWAVVAFGLADLALTIGYFLNLPWATGTWPWQGLQTLDYLLVSSFLAGATAVILWVGLIGDWGALTGATMNVGVMNAGASIYLFHIYAATHDARLLERAIEFAVFAAINAAVLLWSARHPIVDRRPVGKWLRGSFLVFSVVLLYAAIQLFRGSTTIFPWTIEPDTEIMVGWLFLGSAVYFAWGFFRPSWHNARGQLLAFLAYDLVLLPRYSFMFSSVEPEHLPSLVAYEIVLVYSSALAIWYLFIDPRTRGWRIVTPATMSFARIPGRA